MYPPYKNYRKEYKLARELETVARLIFTSLSPVARMYNIRVRITDGDTAGTSRRMVIDLPETFVDMPLADNPNIATGLLVHEISHWLQPLEQLDNLVNEHRIHQQFVNICMDIHGELMVSSMFPMYRYPLEDTRKAIRRKMVGEYDAAIERLIYEEKGPTDKLDLTILLMLKGRCLYPKSPFTRRLNDIANNHPPYHALTEEIKNDVMSCIGYVDSSINGGGYTPADLPGTIKSLTEMFPWLIVPEQQKQQSSKSIQEAQCQSPSGPGGSGQSQNQQQDQEDSEEEGNGHSQGKEEQEEEENGEDTNSGQGNDEQQDDSEDEQEQQDQGQGQSGEQDAQSNNDNSGESRESHSGYVPPEGTDGVSHPDQLDPMQQMSNLQDMLDAMSQDEELQVLQKELQKASRLQTHHTDEDSVLAEMEGQYKTRSPLPEAERLERKISPRFYSKSSVKVMAPGRLNRREIVRSPVPFDMTLPGKHDYVPSVVMCLDVSGSMGWAAHSSSKLNKAATVAQAISLAVERNNGEVVAVLFGSKGMYKKDTGSDVFFMDLDDVAQEIGRATTFRWLTDLWLEYPEHQVLVITDGNGYPPIYVPPESRKRTSAILIPNATNDDDVRSWSNKQVELDDMSRLGSIVGMLIPRVRVG